MLQPNDNWISNPSNPNVLIQAKSKFVETTIREEEEEPDKTNNNKKAIISICVVWLAIINFRRPSR